MFLHRSDIIDLYHHRNAPCLSIYLPTHRAGRAIKQDPIRFKNALSIADQHLKPFMERAPDREKFLSRASALLQEDAFWWHQDLGLAVFVADGQFSVFRCPRSFEELVLVSDRFHLKPLIPLLGHGGQYYLLALSQNSVRLYHGSEDGLRQIDQHDIPTSLSDAVGYDWEQASLQFHSAGQAGGTPGAVHHGQSKAQDIDGEIKTFLHRVDAGVCKLLADSNAPLIVAAVERLYAAYTGLSKARCLVEQGIKGNPDHLDEQALHEKAWPLVEPLMRAPRTQAERTVAQLLEAGDPRAHSDARIVIPAACAGRVETLFIRQDAHLWGSFCGDDNTVTLTAPESAGAEDLLDLAAMETLAHGGSVYVAPADQMPPSADNEHENLVTASLRFTDGTYVANDLPSTGSKARRGQISAQGA